jgi:hypothetical protein
MSQKTIVNQRSQLPLQLSKSRRLQGPAAIRRPMAILRAAAAVTMITRAPAAPQWKTRSKCAHIPYTAFPHLEQSRVSASFACKSCFAQYGVGYGLVVGMTSFESKEMQRSVLPFEYVSALKAQFLLNAPMHTYREQRLCLCSLAITHAHMHR